MENSYRCVRAWPERFFRRGKIFLRAPGDTELIRRSNAGRQGSLFRVLMPTKFVNTTDLLCNSFVANSSRADLDDAEGSIAMPRPQKSPLRFAGTGFLKELAGRTVRLSRRGSSRCSGGRRRPASCGRRGPARLFSGRSGGRRFSCRRSHHRSSARRRSF